MRCVSHSAFANPKSTRSGLTLVELLIVMGILMLLVGAAIPVLSPASDNRRIREAARGLNTFLTAAKVRAKETGRPFGVALKKLSRDTGSADDNGVCVEAYYVEQPAPYAGFDDNSRVILGSDEVSGTGPFGGSVFNSAGVVVRFVRVGNALAQATDYLNDGLDPDPIPFDVIRPGDVLEAGGRRFTFIDDADGGAELQNGYYTPTAGDPDSALFASPVEASIDTIPFLYTGKGSASSATRIWTRPMRYRVLRQPVKTSNAPYQMPAGTAIDLEGSGGVGFDQRLHQPLPLGPDPDTDDADRGYPNNADDIVLMFSPEGSVERLNLNTRLDAPNAQVANRLVSSHLYLLVGMRENIPAPLAGSGSGEVDFTVTRTPSELDDEKQKFNWLHPDARYVTIGAQTGSVVTSEAAFVDPAAVISAVTVAGDPYQQSILRRLEEINRSRAEAVQMSRAGGR